MKFLLVILALSSTFAFSESETNRVILYYHDLNKEKALKYGCLKSEQFEGRKIVLHPNTTFSLLLRECQGHFIGFSFQCFEGSIKVAEEIIKKSFENLVNPNPGMVLSTYVNNYEDQSLIVGWNYLSTDHREGNGVSLIIKRCEDQSLIEKKFQ